MSISTKYKPDFKILDALRGIAALYVVINHSRGHLLMGGSQLAEITPVSDWSIWTKIYYSLLRFTSLGGEFVVVFFVLSGFSIAYSLRNQQNKFKFYLKRLIRLYPPFIFALIWAAFVFYLISIYLPDYNKDLLSVFDSWKKTTLNLIYINDGAYISQFWSLIHEVLFYILAPFLFLKKQIYYIASIVLYITSWYISWDNISGQTIITRFLLDYNFYFFIGVLLFHNYKIIHNYLSTTKIKTYIISIFIVTLMVIIKYLTSDHNKITPLLASILSVVLIINFQSNKILPKWLLWIGVMSYTLYITHFASIKIFHFILIKLKILSLNDKITNPFIWIVGVLFSIIISYIFYLIAENPSKKTLVNIRTQTK